MNINKHKGVIKLDTVSTRLFMTLQHTITALAYTVLYCDKDKLAEEITEIRHQLEKIAAKHLEDME